MKTIKGYYVDDNNNKWDVDLYAKKIAIELSDTLIDCQNCINCSRCYGCSNYKENPNRYVGQYIGSRNSQTTTYWLDDNIQVVCGCWKGNLEQFKQRIDDVYASDTLYGQQYRNYINIVYL